MKVKLAKNLQFRDVYNGIECQKNKYNERAIAFRRGSFFEVVKIWKRTLFLRIPGSNKDFCIDCSDVIFLDKNVDPSTKTWWQR